MKRNGIVMLMALALIMILTFAVLRSTTTTENYLKDMSDTVFSAQLNRTFLDMTTILRNVTKDIDKASQFKVLVQMPLVISDDKTSLEGVMTMSANGGKFNINKLIKNDENKTVNQPLYDLLYSIVNSYQINDSLLLMSMILDTIDTDKKERSFGSELAYKTNAKIGDGGIPNKATFDTILEAYANSQEDGNVYDIPWDKFVAFTGAKVDYNYLSPKVKQTLEDDYSISVPYGDSLIEKAEDLSLDDEQKQVFKDLNITYYVPKVLCNFEFFYMDKQAQVDFVYDLQSRRISDIETIF